MTVGGGAGRSRFAARFVAVVLTVLLLLLFWRAAGIFLLLLLATLFSLYLVAVSDALGRFVRLPRPLALLLAVLLTAAGMVGLFLLFVPAVVEQTNSLVSVLPDTINGWEASLDRAVTRIPELRAIWAPGQHQVLRAIYSEVGTYARDFVPKLVGVFGLTIELLSVGIMAVYLALNPSLYRERLIGLFPPVHRDFVRSILIDLARTLRSWLVGQLAAMLLLGALSALGLYLLHVPFWATFGVFTGVASIVPYFGSLVSTILPALFVLGADDGGGRALAVILLGIGVHLIEGNLVSPLIMERQVRLPPVFTMMSVLIMGALLGPIGLIVAVPVLAIIDVIVRRILLNRIYEGHGFRRVERDSTFVVHAPAPAHDVVVPATPIDVLAHAEARRQQVA